MNMSVKRPPVRLARWAFLLSASCFAVPSCTSEQGEASRGTVSLGMGTEAGKGSADLSLGSASLLAAAPPWAAAPLTNSSGAALSTAETAAGHEFGSAVSLSGDLALVGAPLHDGVGADSGAAYLFERTAFAWSKTQTFVANDAAAGDQFGASVSLEGAIAVVGAAQDEDAGAGTGSAYVFERNASAYLLTAKISAFDAAAGDHFGHAVSVSGARILVGASHDDVAEYNSGSAYVFERGTSGWEHRAKLVQSAARSSDHLGSSVSLDGDRALVGARGGLTRDGQAFVFERSAAGYTQVAKLTASNGSNGNRFGVSSSLHGDRALVGAGYYSFGSSGPGAAYVFERSAGNWLETAELASHQPEIDDAFGHSVSLEGELALVGAPAFDALGVLGSGAAFLFERSASAWTQRAMLAAPNANGRDGLGFSVSHNGGFALVGGPTRDGAGAQSGAAFVYGLGPLGQACSDRLQCRSGACVDGVCCDGACSGACERCDLASSMGSCQIVSALEKGPGCAPYRCDGRSASCATTCAGDGDCEEQYHCATESCQPNMPLSQSCAAGRECASGHCVDGICCDAACDGACERCDGDGLRGVCTLDAQGSVGRGSCDAYLCDGASSDCPSTCADGSACASGNHCESNACFANVLAGEACDGAEMCQPEYCTDGVCCVAADCSPYLCGPGGSCELRCQSSSQCAAGHECSSAGDCEARQQDSAAEQAGGCGFNTSGDASPNPSGSGFWALLFATLWRRSALRRRLRGS